MVHDGLSPAARSSSPARPTPWRGHILYLGGPDAALAAPVAATLRACFGDSHAIELLRDPGDVIAVIRTFQRTGRAYGAEVEVVVAEAPAEATPEAAILRAHWPAARWVRLDKGARDVSGEVPVTEIGAAIRAFRQQRLADIHIALARMELLRDLPPDRLARIADCVEVRRYEAGDTVVRAGEPGDGVYFIHSGDAKVLDDESLDGERVIARRGPGEHFGELSLITGEPRSNSVVTDLDSELFFLSKRHYDDLMIAEPVLGIRLTRVLGTRLARAHHRHHRTPRIVGCCRVLAARGDGVGAQLLAEAFATETHRAVVLLDLEAHDPSCATDRLEQVIARLPGSSLSREDCAGVAPGTWRLAARRPSTLQSLRRPQVLPGLLQLLTEAFDFVVVAVGIRTPSEVLVRVAKQSDILLLHVGRGASELREASELMALLRQECPLAESKLVLAAEPRPASEVESNPEIRLGRAVSHVLPAAPLGGATVRAHRRVARRLVGIGVGLSLGGGGARGAAHIGVLEVLEQEGIPVDLISGTSVGAIIGGGHAMERSTAEALELWRRETRVNPMRRYTLSKTAVFSARGLEAMLRRLFGDLSIEELPIPFWAMATDLRRGAAIPIDRGPLWLAVRASCSLPGAVTPVCIGDSYLVDGGVSNNVPADVLRSQGARFVIAVDISRERGFEVAGDGTERRSWVGRKLRRVPRLREFLEAPSMIHVMMRAMEVQALQTIRARAWSWNVRIRPEVGEFSSTDFSGTDALIARGREAAVASLPDIRAGVRALLDEV